MGADPIAHDPDRSVARASDLGVYVHFPYCKKKCPYCDFNSYADPAFDGARYAEAIVAELGARSSPYAALARPLRSVYFGGGTPSLWAPDAVARVLEAIRALFALPVGAEVTLEANPGTDFLRHLDAYRAAGINRFSVGVQSLRDPELVWLGRIHDARAGSEAMRAIRESGATLSMDLMFGLPGQTWGALEETLAQAIAHRPDHISAYALTLEPGTPLAVRIARNEIPGPDDDIVAQFLEALPQRLEAHGYARYEISSYAQRGREAVHNSLYWAGAPYLGVGAGAHSYLPAPGLRTATRRAGLEDPDAYLEHAGRGHFPAESEEQLDRQQLVQERLVVGVRTRWGVDLAALASEGEDPALPDRLAPTIAALVRDGLLREEGGGRIVPTPRGYLFNDRIARALFDGAALPNSKG